MLVADKNMQFALQGALGCATAGSSSMPNGKPLQPKEAMEAVCRVRKGPRSSAI
ncbi:hypothetical protein ACCUM_2758 [Candidatus Accumulibacter phosphatis]|uniref:Uncharacterized protein n=1 Tax=Candidatus Accumulibacter phosphatis TaxID=327160 RepID=A0A5S4EHR0_9PROT|nr:hypothetical protein ACCUM_2758 [Candidatus Accumulibacter phosphatis]